MLQKGLTAGGLTAIFLTIFTELTSQGRRRLQSEVNVEELPRINKFLQDFSLSRGWNDEMSDRLYAVAEETLLILAPQDEDRRLLLVFASSNGPTAELEFISAPSHADNLEDRIALLKKPVPEIPELETMVERDVSLRLLRYYASSVSHQQYRDTEIITVRVAPLGGE